MKRYQTVLLALLLPVLAVAQEADGLRSVPPARVRFDYNVHFDWFFVNNEYGASLEKYGPSRTMTGLRLTPLAGLRIDQPNGWSHRLLGGIDIEKDFGASPFGTGEESDRRQENWNLFRELKVYYTFGAQFGKTDFSFVAGIYPRYETRGRYTTAVLADPVRFYDNNLEGLLLRFGRPKSYYEVGLDWNSKYGIRRHERFNIFTYGDVYILSWLHFGWQGMLQHYAGAQEQKGVVDEHFLNPYLTFDFAPMTGLQALSLQTGLFAGYQRDRRWKDVQAPLGLDVVTTVRHWNFGLRNEFYWGQSMMPLYTAEDSEGVPYGDRLYYRGAYWQVRTDPAATPAVYDRLEAFWEPRISDFLRIRVAAVAHFNEGYSGWQQIATLFFDLDKLIPYATHKDSSHRPGGAHRMHRSQGRRVPPDAPLDQ